MADILLATRARLRPVARERDEREFETLAWPYILALPVFYLLGFYAWAKKQLLWSLDLKVHRNSFLVDGISINSRKMKEGATRWPSLDTCYNFTEGQGPTAIHRLIDVWWMHIRNAQAVRNRLKIAKRELRKEIEKKYQPGHPVKILSLASGSAQGVIEVAAELKQRGIETEIVLVDHDDTALRHARDLAHQHGIEVKTIEGKVVMFNKLIGDFKADIVEMMGLLDYLNDTIGPMLLRKIRLYLPIGGTFFCCHIHPNQEQFFLKWAVDWDGNMLYRTVRAFEEILHKGSFVANRIITEPLGIHSVSISQKI